MTRRPPHGVRLNRDPVIEGGYTAIEGRFTITPRRGDSGWVARRYLVHDRTGRARWYDPLIPEGNSQTTVRGLAAVRQLIADQLDEEERARP